jgi:hypothetical protein
MFHVASGSATQSSAPLNVVSRIRLGVGLFLEALTGLLGYCQPVIALPPSLTKPHCSKNSSN